MCVVMSEILELFRMTLKSWNEEERKHLLSHQEIKQIDDLISEMNQIIQTNCFT